MRTCIFYFSENKTGDDCQPIGLPSGKIAWVRVTDAGDIRDSDALDLAELREGEMLLNTVETETAGIL